MLSLRDILNNKRDQNLTFDETIKLVTDYKSTSSNSGWSERAKFILYITEGLEKGYIDPDNLLAAAIPSVKIITDLIIVSIAIRYGANKNLYVQTPGVGSAHIMVYAVTTLREKGCDTNLINNVLLFLRILGSQNVVNAFDQSGGKMDTSDKDTNQGDKLLIEAVSEALSSSPKKEESHHFGSSTYAGIVTGAKTLQSVQEWLVSQGLSKFDNLDLEIEKIREINPDLLANIGTIVDRPDLAYRKSENLQTKELEADKDFKMVSSPNGLSPALKVDELSVIIPNLSLALTARANKIISTYQSNSGVKISSLQRGSYYGLSQSVDLCNFEGFRHFLDIGQSATYFTINQIVLNLRLAAREGDVTLTNVYQNMLSEAISKGTPLDVEQIGIVSTTSDYIAQSIIQTYQQPMWKKVCSINVGNVPDSIKTLSFNLGINPDGTKSEICSQIQSLSQADPQALKEAAIQQQRLRVAAGVNKLSDFVGDQIPYVTCQNRTSLQKDPFTFGNLTMSFYNNSGRTYCFTSDTYETLIASPYNPHEAGNTRLPTEFIETIKLRLELLKKMGINPNNPLSVTDAIDELSKDDDITSKESDYIVTTICNSAHLAGITPENIKMLKAEQMASILRTIDMEQPNMHLMTLNHRLITFCRAAYTLIKLQPLKAKTFFDGVRVIGSQIL